LNYLNKQYLANSQISLFNKFLTEKQLQGRYSRKTGALFAENRGVIRGKQGRYRGKQGRYRPEIVVIIDSFAPPNKNKVIQVKIQYL